MFGKHKTEALVVGAGPVGLMAAAQLAKRKMSVRIVDAGWQGTGLSYALGLHPGSMDLLDELGLAEPVVDAGYRVDKIAFHEGGTRREVLDLTALGCKYPFLTILPQNTLERGLEGWLHANQVKVEWNHRVAGIADEGPPVQVTLERLGEDSTGYAVARRIQVIEKTSAVEANFVLGADGHQSVVRRHLSTDFEQIGDPALFAVFEFETDVDLHHQAHVILNPDTTNVLWPLPGGRCRWSFQLTDQSEFDGDRVKTRLSELGRWILPALDQGRLEALIAERAPWFEGSIREIIWSVAIRFEKRLAASFGRNGLWLAGDSAHLANPVGVHSMNVGFREVHDLVERRQAVLHQGAADQTMHDYDAERRAEWRQLFDLDHALKPAAHASDFVKANAARILGCAPASGTLLQELLRPIGLELP
jgi:2-polyprenyl-6-methoxyphenol hydroxylase-like FAD-dependent oxidoreductase